MRCFLSNHLRRHLHIAARKDSSGTLFSNLLDDHNSELIIQACDAVRNGGHHRTRGYLGIIE